MNRCEMLIVDDEKFAVEGIMNGNDWAALGIEAVYGAGSADEARAVMLERPIDILICDIEMPDEDGLSLAKWVKEHYPNTEFLFLTCHSEFAYAKQAIHLGSFDYLLKPADSGELAQVVTRMMATIRERREQSDSQEKYQKYYALYSKQLPLVVEHFWQDVLSRRILSFGDFLDRALRDAQLELTSSDCVQPILISIEEWKKPLQERDQEALEYAVKKAAEEILLEGRPGHMVTDKNGVLFVLAYGPQGEERDCERWLRAASAFKDACLKYFYCQVSCYIGYFALLQELPEQCDGLKKMERSNVTKPHSVLLYDKAITPPPSSSVSEHVSMSKEEWLSVISSGNRDKVIELIGAHVARLEEHSNGNPRQLETYLHQFLQVIYHFLYARGIEVSQIPNFSMWSTAQIRTLAQFKYWAVNLASAVMDTVFHEEESEGVVQKSIQFMKENVEEDISREDVAAYVHLNPAYLSRLFKKETGRNLIDYLIETKVNRAKLLLDTTDMTVSAIAQQVGYSNFSHFTRTFKKHTGVNPQEYRKHSS
ncbi:response regulator transcription factor [Paenibacillus montanisoli]|uniref:response regulator transcription factor n=1 Tax=Paenibacillus montanisoli TaxID=2081970 RepID=UPI001F0C7DC2|nr:helix-turn-helix domain-containing protein [Paenibacillus montanisoli]